MIVISQMILYSTPTSAIDTVFEIITLIIYPVGAIKNEKKYNQNHFLISFSPNVWSGNSSLYQLFFMRF
jgi:hypothetical protein